MKQQTAVSNVRLGKFVQGGQTMAHLPDGKAVFVWGGLPSELVTIKLVKQKSSYAEAIVTEVIEASPDRVEPLEPQVYLSTSPWQIVSWNAENKAKQEILEETFARAGVAATWQKFCENAGLSTAQVKDAKTRSHAPFVVGSADNPIENPAGIFHYRNKMEFGFFGDDDGLHLAHYVRGSHGKQIADSGSVLAMEPINCAAQAITAELNRLKVWGGDLKTVVVRCSQKGQTVAALFIKKENLDMSDFKMPDCLAGLDIYFSHPKSPASVPTKKIVSFGSCELEDEVLDNLLRYSVLSFFQVNIPIFHKALHRIDALTPGSSKIDLYSGVGSIGIALSGTDLLVESDENSIRMARQNVKGTDIKVVHATSETVLDHIDSKHVVIVDPPRAGLHQRLVDRLLEALPPKIVYLSCNPATQARDVSWLTSRYSIMWAEGYNFFPRTPHIESLIVLELK